MSRSTRVERVHADREKDQNTCIKRDSSVYNDV